MASRVVLPEPVPPVTRKDSRAATTARSHCAPTGVTVPAATSASRVHGRRAATRSDTVVPVRATGGRTACSRMPPGSGASHQGTASSSRRPASVASRWASRRTAASSRKRTRHPLQAGAAVDPDGVRPVDQDVGDVGVAQIGLERAGADELAAQRLRPPRGGRGRRAPVPRRAAPRRPSRVTGRFVPCPRPAGRGPARPGRARRRRPARSSHLRRRWPGARDPPSRSSSNWPHSRASGPRPVRAGASPRSRAAARPGSARAQPARGRPRLSATTCAGSPPGAGPRTTTSTRLGERPDGRGDAGRGRGRPDLRRDQQPRHVAARQRLLRCRVDRARQVDEHQVMGSRAGREHGLERIGVDGQR